MGISNIIVLLGGVAMFLFGMQLMGDGLKKVAGNKLELILFKLSGTPVRGMLLGMGVTAVIQSSAATSVMVVGFVNSGMMRLRQAIAVIMGAIVGTAITGWIICLSEVGGGASVALSLLSTESLSAIVAVIGILCRMLSKKKLGQHIGDILMGFAVLMFGMKTMSGAVSGLKENPAFIGLLTSFRNPVIGILIGIVFTAILQSASASIGILQALSSTGAITFDMALPIVLGIAIGASVPVLVSAVGSSKDGKRAAGSYLTIEVLRVILFAAVFYIVNAVVGFSFMGNTMNMVSIALLNTLFRASTILILSPFGGLIERFIRIIVPDREDDSMDSEDMDRLEERFLRYPQLAVEQSRLAINAMARVAARDLELALDLVGNYSDTGFKEVENLEGLVDRYEDKIGSYLMKLTSVELNDEQNKAVSQYLRAITDFERISDHALNIAESAQEMSEKNIHFTEDGEKALRNLMAAAIEIMTQTNLCFEMNDAEKAHRIEPLEQVIDRICRDMRAQHTERLRRGECTIGNGYVYNDLISDLSRISDHCSNIGIVIVEVKQNALDVHELSGMIKNEHVNDFEQYYDEFAAKYLA